MQYRHKTFKGWLRVTFMVKPGFHISGKSQTIGDFTFWRPSQILPIYRIFARGMSHIFSIISLVVRDDMFIWGRGTAAQQFRGLVVSEIHRRRILQICHRSFQTIGDICDFEFFISRQNLGWLKSRKIPDRLGFSDI